MIKKWTEIPPVPPAKKPSKFYWHRDRKSKEVWPVELWPGRYIHHYDGLWTVDPIDDPPEIPEELLKAQSKPRKKALSVWKNVKFDEIKKGDIAKYVAHANLYDSIEITVTKKYKDRITGYNHTGKHKLYKNDEQWQIRRK
jgi:hypothetical protein